MNDKTPSENILELVNISKYFGSFQALKEVSLTIKKGEILAVLGENGAGKSTLMKILSGLYQPDNGKININRYWFTKEGEDMPVETTLPNPRTAMIMGLGMVYQHFQLVEPFTVAENITLGQEFSKKNFPIIDTRRANEEVRQLSEKLGLPIDPTAKVEDLPVGLKQRVEILKQLYRNAELLILDEPTAVLTPQEVEELFKTMKNLKKAGKSLIFISHKLHEPLAIADRIVVIRGGKMVGEILPKDATKEVLAEMVVGSKLMQQRSRKKIETNSPILTFENVKLEEDEKIMLENINFTADANQIVGIAGVVGNGQRQLLESIMGIRKISSGKIIYSGLDTPIELHTLSTQDILKQSIAYIPEDRSSEGLVLDFPITDNVWLAYHSDRDQANDYYNYVSEDKLGPPKNRLESIERVLLIPRNMIAKITQSIVNIFDVKTSSINNSVRNLSGGNQQKVVIGREFSKFPKLVIAAEPTRGVDIGVMTQVHEELIKMRDEGASIIVVSSDLDEVLSLADKLMIMYNGKIVGSGPTEDFTISQISQLMTTGEVQEVFK